MLEKVLVTGGGGFVAGWCIVQLLARGYQVRATLRSLGNEAAVRAAIEAAAGAGERLEFVAADLTQDGRWDAAMTGCGYVLHVASPLGGSADQDLTSPARDGTLRVLTAATRAGVRRVVMTSAATAATPPMRGPDSLSDESVWFDLGEKKVDPYRLSKRLAERAAWDFMIEQAGSTTFATVLPGAVFGPLLAADKQGSVQVISRLLRGRVPGNPRIGFEIVDVRDLADLHIRAMLAPEAAGQRFIAVGDFMWMADISRTLRSRLGESARKVPTRDLPNVVLRLAALFDPSVRMLAAGLGRMHRHSPDKAYRLLGWKTRPAETTLVDCAQSLITHGAI